MARVDVYLWLIFVTILSLIMHSFGATLEGIRRSTAMSLILLKHYQEQVAIYGERADETHRLQFIDKWSVLLQDHHTAVEVLNHTEKDWMYILHLVRKSSDISMNLMETSNSEHWPEILKAYFTDSIVTLHTKLFARYHVMLYLERILYHSFVPSETALHDCKNVAIHLLVFIHQGTDELLQSMIRIFDCFLSAAELSIFKEIWEGLEVTNEFQLHSRYLITVVESIMRSNLIDIQRIEMITRKWYRGAILVTSLTCQQQENFLLNFTLGALENTVRKESYLGPIQDFDEMTLFWSKAVHMNKYYTTKLVNGTNEDADYTTADVLRASLINRAELCNASLRNIVEMFEIMIPDKFKIFIENNSISTNANLKNEYY